MRYFVLLLFFCLAVFVGSSLVILVPITVGFGTLGGKSVVMALLPGLVSRPRKVFSMCCWCCLVILLVLLLRCWVGSCPFGTVLVILLVEPTWSLPARGHGHGLFAEFAFIGECSSAQLSGLVGGSQPTNTQPTNTQPTNTQPTNTQPTNTQPTNTQPTKKPTNQQSNKATKQPQPQPQPAATQPQPAATNRNQPQPTATNHNQPQPTTTTTTTTRFKQVALPFVLPVCLS